MFSYEFRSAGSARLRLRKSIVLATVALAFGIAANAFAQNAPDAAAAPIGATTSNSGNGPQGSATPQATLSPVQSKPASSDFTLTLKAGVAQDSDVAISQINTSSGQRDGLATLGLSTGYKIATGSSSSITLGYDFSQTLHQTLTADDIQLHSVSVSGALKLGHSDLGLSYSFNHVLLGGHPFLNLQFVSPSILIPVNSKTYLRPSLVYLDERFPVLSAHNARHIQPSLQAFYFFDNARAFVLLEANYQREKTDGAEFAYNGYALDASVTVPFRLRGIRGKAKGGYEWLVRDYDTITPSIGAIRFDRAATYRLGAEFPLIKRLSLNLEAKHIGRRSNVAFANLSEDLGSAELVYRFR